MIPMRQSGAAEKNALFTAQPPEAPKPSRATKAMAAGPPPERNLTWLRQMRKQPCPGRNGCGRIRQRRSRKPSWPR